MPKILLAWGFAYKSTGFVWVKCNKDGRTFTRLGQGYGTRKQAELCRLGTRGNPKCGSRRIREVTISPRRNAHQKPDLYPDIEQLFAGPYVELFARQRWPGWDVAFSREADTGPAPRRWRSNSYQGKPQPSA
jgi:N6-adenosine-specific RNA methylase IME4